MSTRMKWHLASVSAGLVCAASSLASFGVASCASKSGPPAGSAGDVEPPRHASDAPAIAAASAATEAPPSVSAAPSPSSPSSPSNARKAAGEVLLGDIEAPKQFNPKPTLEGLKSQFEGCYKSALGRDASIHGRLKVRFVVEESGKLSLSDDAGNGSLKDAALIACVNDALKGASFPKPGGTATVTFPLSFR